MRTLLLSLLLLAPLPAAAQTYVEDRAAITAERSVERSELTPRLLAGFDTLAKHWMGTTWGLGVPQTSTPGEGKINCGTFVGTMLRDLGFDVSVKKLQRQPAELIIKTFSAKKDIKRFRNRPVEEFVEGVRKMGDGLYIIGLDFHVGFLRVEGGDVRFVHASYVTHTVVDEDAAIAEPIVSSKYRVVGKLLDDDMLEDWQHKRRIRVKGNW